MMIFNAVFNAFWGLSGGDRILVECSRRWAKAGVIINFFTVERGYYFCRSYKLRGVNYEIWSSSRIDRFGFLVSYMIRIMRGCIKAMSTQLPSEQDVAVFVYSSSDFWPDSLPSWIFKMRFKNVKWIAGFYLFSSIPLSKDTPYKGRRFLKGFFYYFSQLPVFTLIRKYADMVWVTNESDRWRFIGGKKLSGDKVIAVRGGVDTKTPALIPEPERKEFDAVFVGRFHPQKGVLELIDIWRYVCTAKKDAKLAVIGVGELESEVRAKIKKHGLEKNVILFGFKDGIEKLKIFKDSKVVVHPATYDSGGMAACEAMACGLPGVSFDLPALRTYYPKGMLKTPCYDLKKFAENILSLLSDEGLYIKTAEDALSWAKEWDWDKRTQELLQAIRELI